jgi:L-fucose isomerase-like protein
MTLLRLSLRADGALRLFVSEGEIVTERSAANRAAGFFRPAHVSAEALVRHFIDAGYEHHVTAVYGRWASAAAHLGRQLGVTVDHA